MTDAFKLEQILVRANGKTLFSVSSLPLRAGAITAVIGPNGAGKSTMLRLLNLLQRPDEGTLHYFSRPVDWQPKAYRQRLAIQREMAFVFQKTALFDASVFQNAAIGLKLRRLPKGEIRERVRWALELVGLEKFMDRHAHSLSGGEAQRLALARAIVTRPRVLLLDEATANLDPKNVEIMEKVLLQIHGETKTTIIMVTHNLQQAKRLADECLFLCEGNVVEHAPAERFFHQPATPELRDFISGRMIY